MMDRREQKDEIIIRYEDEEQNIKSIKEKSFSMAEAKRILDEIYAEDIVVHQPFGRLVDTIMREKGITKEWRGEIILDAPRARKLTGLYESVFRTSMFKLDCTIDMSMVVSMCIGFKLSAKLTHKLLDAAGLSLRLDNPDHRAYLFLLEHCRDLSVKECNEVLERFGVKKYRQLGSHGRGPNGQPGEYSK